MPEQLKPFMSLVAKLYLNYGYEYYPLCKYKQEKIDVKEVVRHVNDYLMLLQSYNRLGGKKWHF
jgi:hypothetical protein|tara:strand:- start:16 stop:207 length:192 start_codon:yes stop_codon:yes gene_type:complete